MPVVAVVNRKGGSGKSTLATHLAAWCAHQGYAVMLGDVDRQQSSRSWLRRRNPTLPTISPWSVDQNTLKVPTGITHVVLDTPGGLHGLDLARMVMFADVILMPVCGSSFDRESAADCHAELMALPRVAGGRCRVASIGMRIDPRTRNAQALKDWAAGLGIPFLGVLRESQAYVQTLERGMTIFDVPGERAAVDVRQWQPLLQWLAPQLLPQARSAGPAPVTHGTSPGTVAASLAARPATAASVPGPSPRPATAPAMSAPVARSAVPGTAPTPPTAAPASTPASTPVARPVTATTPTPVHGLLIASRPVTPVTRLPNTRVLDRVARSGPPAPVNAAAGTRPGAHTMVGAAPPRNAAPSTPAASAGATSTAAGTVVPPIPSFLKLVKC